MPAPAFASTNPQWEAAREAAAPAPRKPSERAPERERPRSRRLGYHEQCEWDGMEQAIVDAKAALAAAQRAADDPAIASDPVALQEHYAALEAARAEVDRRRALGAARGQASAMIPATRGPPTWLSSVSAISAWRSRRATASCVR